MEAPGAGNGVGVAKETHMNQITPITDTPAGPALRLELIRLLLPVAGRDVVEVARCAEDYIIGLSPRPAPRTMADAIVDLSDRARTQPPVIGHGDEPEPAAEDDKGWDAIIMPGDEPATTASAQIGDTTVAIDPAPAPRITRVGWWTPERDADLLRYRADGATSRKIAEMMGASSGGAVDQRLLHLRRRSGAPPEAPPAPASAPDRKERLADMVRDGGSAEFMAADLGLTADQVVAQIPRQCLSGAWAEAKGRDKDSAEPLVAPVRERLPEDRLRRTAEPEPAAPATIDFVADYLRGCGQTVGLNEGGVYTLNGCVVPPKRLLAAANTYRTANGLPPFSVRGL